MLVSCVLAGGFTVPFAVMPPKSVGAVTKTNNSTLELLGIVAIAPVNTLFVILMLETSDAPTLLF